MSQMGADSWHSEEIKTPPNSEDKFAEVEDDDAFLVFREGTRFREIRLEVGMKFNTKMDFKEAVREYCIQEGRRVRFKKNDKIQCRALCKVEDCPWVIYASKDSESVCWQVKTFNDDHTCPRETKNRLANKGWLASKLVKKLRKFLNLKHSEALTYFKSKCDLELNKSSLTRALGDTRHIVYGDAAAQYGMVRDYGETLLKCNPGSTGFKAGCRPLIGLDGAFLKTRFGGQILTAIGQDANNHIYVIAYAIVPVQNTNNWRWFLELLHDDLGSYTQNGCYFISDMQKVDVFFVAMFCFHDSVSTCIGFVSDIVAAMFCFHDSVSICIGFVSDIVAAMFCFHDSGLITAVQEVFPDVHHRFCVWHLWRNFNKQWKDMELRGLLWECARSTTQEGFVEGMMKIQRDKKEAWEYLAKWQRDAWSRAFFPTQPKCDNICGKGHDKRNCAKKKADDEAAAVAASAAAAASEANTGNQQQPLPTAPEVPDKGNATEIEVGNS
ncbi:uncharacterized protein LOC107615748 [Arachis ipaensis]|uniref:uncharacterized protein LOC107615748 n=1 Tax=Arachis ipaensis TaxID=130454 RepID=UPI0007AFA2FD|nr:uncharacterized protein LOC107615748 [Arachis ipaensis]XP_025678710.1 uncharacterized protein LOC112778623 [Arachis hypogaea]